MRISSGCNHPFYSTAGTFLRFAQVLHPGAEPPVGFPTPHQYMKKMTSARRRTQSNICYVSRFTLVSGHAQVSVAYGQSNIVE